MISQEPSVVEIKPEVVFLYEILKELTRRHIQIPRFQRAFVWRRDQMTDLLDSINKQYPIGSLLVWETSEKIAILDQMGPFRAQSDSSDSAGYLLDGHQRLLTLAGALLPSTDALERIEGRDDGTWEMYWNLSAKKFQHKTAADEKELLFPMTALLDTVRFLDEIEELRPAMGADSKELISEISGLARTFQSYRVPVIRMKQTGLSEAVEIFARLNSRGQSMTADQMISALTFQQDELSITFDLATEIDDLLDRLGDRNFGDIDRNTILRAILANIDENIYKTDWTKIAREKRESLQLRLSDAVARTGDSVDQALTFLESIGVSSSRLLPYGLQLVLLSAFFDTEKNPSSSQLDVLRRWFWVSSFSAWFGGANPSRIGALIREFRAGFARNRNATSLDSFDLRAEALPYPLNFDMRSARTKALLLVMLDADPIESGSSFRDFAVDNLTRRGPSAVGQILRSSPRETKGNPANRAFRSQSSQAGSMGKWVLERADQDDLDALVRAGIEPDGVRALQRGDDISFIRLRQQRLIEIETEFQLRVGVVPSSSSAAEAPVDSDYL